MNSVIMKPYRISDINFDNIVYSNLKGGKNKKVVYIKYDDNKINHKLTFQTTSLLNTDDIKKKNGFYELDIPLYGKSSNKVNQLIKFFKNFDKKLINDARVNSNKWFEGIKNITYKSIIRTSSKKGEHYDNGIIRIKISENSTSKPLILDKDGNAIDLDSIKKNSYIKMILECYAIWITENGFGLYLKPLVLSVTPIEKVIYKYELLEDSEEENDNEVIEDVLDTEVNPTTSNAFLKNSNDESYEKSSYINLPQNILKMEEDEDIEIEKVEVLEMKQDLTEEVTSYDDNTEDNIQTYKNYSTDVINNNKVEPVELNLAKQFIIDEDTSEDELEEINIIEKKNKNNVPELSKISLVDSDLNNSSEDDFSEINHIIKNNI